MNKLVKIYFYLTVMLFFSRAAKTPDSNSVIESLSSDNVALDDNVTSNLVIEKQRPTTSTSFIQWLQGIVTGHTTRRPSTTTSRPVVTTVTSPIQCQPCKCGITNKKTRIVGGQETHYNEYPWVAQLLYNGRFYCGAALINNRYVLTASHCVSGFSASSITVRLLEHNRVTSNPKKIDRKLSRVIMHPLYSASTYDNDIAVLQFDRPVEMKDELRPACLPTTKRAFNGESGIVTGWGAVKENGATSNTLQEVTVPILSNTECRRSNYGTTRITDNMLCAGYPNGLKDSCQGDSGGPMHIVQSGHYEIVGVVSWGEGCAKPKYPGVYARVNRFSTWIAAMTKDGCYC